MSESVLSPKPVLVTGATGYVGGRLIPKLLESGHNVRAMSRSLEKLRHRAWARLPQVELAAGNVLEAESLEKAVEGCEAVYYLVHSMVAGQKDFADADRRAAQNMVAATEKAGVKRIIYLGGLGESDSQLSHHLRSRAEVAKILQSGSVPVTFLRAAMIIGSGSASFEILRYLVERLPVMITPRWLKTPCEPIAIRNVIQYLTGCLEDERTAGKTFDIGSGEVITYAQLMQIYAEEAGLPKRWVIPVPVLTPRLSSYWIHFVTPVPAAIALPLAEGLRNPVICHNDEIRHLIPQVLLRCREAIRLAIRQTRESVIPSHWTDAGLVPPLEGSYEGDPGWAGGTVFEDSRALDVGVPAAKVWRVLARIGGKTGWYHANHLWGLRGALDRLAGGVGLKRGRRDSRDIRPGDALDFWRVLRVVPEQNLLMAAEMKLPGRATLEFNLQNNSHGSRLTQTARFLPRGLWGLIYWYCVLPFHHYVFDGMLKKIAKAAAEEKE